MLPHTGAVTAPRGDRTGRRGSSEPPAPASHTANSRADHRPLLTTLAVGVVSLLTLLLAIRGGWLGPDIGRGDGFCEAARPGLIRQPVNTWSNLAFVAAGLAIAHRARHPRHRFSPHPGLTTVYAIVVTLLGPASMAMHATQSALGGRLDMLSMYLIAGFALGYAAMRVFDWGPRGFAICYVLVLVGSELTENLGPGVPLVHTSGNLAFALTLVLAVALETVLIVRRDRVRRNGFGYAALGVLLIAFVIWNLSQRGTPLCDPWSPWQGHGAWHALDALAAYLLHRYWASERPARATPGRSDARALHSRT